METKVCMLSGLVIPQGKYSKDHYLPRAVCPPNIYSLPQNIFPSIKIFNQVKSAYYPCQWYEARETLCYHAYVNWNIKDSDKKLLRQALESGLPIYDPCEYCIASKLTKYCVKNAHDYTL